MRHLSSLQAGRLLIHHTVQPADQWRDFMASSLCDVLRYPGLIQAGTLVQSRPS